MGTLAHSEDPDEMWHNAIFHQILHSFLRFKQPSRPEIHHDLENSTLNVQNGQSNAYCISMCEYKGLMISLNSLCCRKLNLCFVTLGI